MNIENDNQFHLDRFKHVPPHPSYIAGFIDGDGCIFIRKIRNGHQSGLSITQCRTNVLQVLRYHFGGSITSSGKRNDKTVNTFVNMDNDCYDKCSVRNQYNLVIRNNEYQIIVEYLKDSFIVKERQYKCLHDFNKIANSQNKCEEREQLYTLCSTYNKKCNYENANSCTNDTIWFSRLNNEYIAGLFDSEGCFYINYNTCKFYISISQKNHPYLLREIARFLGYGMVSSDKLKFKIYKKSDCLKFIQLIKGHLIVKYRQAEAFETYLETSCPIVRDKMYKICNKEKHEIEFFSELNQNNKGKEMYVETVRLKNMKQQICKEIHNRQVYREKSEKMKGSGNHNYGKTFSQETKKKLSNSIRDAKCGVSDDIIIKVRDLIKEGRKNIEIEGLLNLSRHVVSRIKNGRIVCRCEEKDDKPPCTQIENNIAKRKIKTDEIIVVIEKFIENWKPMKILDYLNKTRCKNNEPLNITIDIIKNIKRKLSNGKTIIYESEIEKNKYSYYTSLINTYRENMK